MRLRLSETGSLVLMGAMALATLGGVLLTSNAKKEAQAHSAAAAAPSFDERLNALDKPH